MPDRSRPVTVLSGAAAVVGLLALLCGAGAGLLGLAARPGAPGREPLSLAWCFLLGSAFVGLLLHLPLALDGRIGRWGFATALAVALALTLTRGISFVRSAEFGGAGIFSSLRALPFWARVAAILLLALTISTAVTRFSGWDERAIWGLHARILYGSGGLRGEEFTDLDRLLLHPRYPLLIPLLEAVLFWVQGSAEDTLVKFLFAAFFFSLLSVVLSEIQRRAGAKAAGFSGLLLLTVPVLARAGMTGDADVPLACYATAGAIQIARWLERPDGRRAVLAGAFLGAAVLVKMEGILWLLAIGAAIVWALMVRRRPWPFPSWRGLLLGAALLAACLIIAVAARRSIPYSPYWDLYAGAFRASWLVSVLDRPVRMAPYVLGQVSDRGAWGWCWLPVAAGLFLRRRFPPGADVLFLRAAAASMLGGYLVVFILTPFHLYWHLTTAFSRLILQVYPLVLLVLAEHVEASGWLRQLAHAVEPLESSDIAS